MQKQLVFFTFLILNYCDKINEKFDELAECRKLFLLLLIMEKNIKFRLIFIISYHLGDIILNTNNKQKTKNIVNVLMILSLMLAILGCRPLSNFFDPAKNAPKKQLKVVKRDKPNLADDTEEREVDPNSAELVEATDEEAKSTDNTVVSQPNNNSNSNASNTNTANSKQETNQTAATKTFANGLLGKWSDGKETVTFDEKTAVFQWLNQDKPYNTTSYRVINENTVEFTDAEGKANKATMSIEDGGNTLVWLNQNSGETFKYKRVTGTNSQPEKKPEKPVTQTTPSGNNQKPTATPYKPPQHDQE